MLIGLWIRLLIQGIRGVGSDPDPRWRRVIENKVLEQLT